VPAIAFIVIVAAPSTLRVPGDPLGLPVPRDPYALLLVGAAVPGWSAWHAPCSPW
jgi:hypothetical protein